MKENSISERIFSGEVFSKLNVYLLNTVETPDESLKRIKDLATR